MTILKLNFQKIWRLWRDKCCKSEHEGEEKALHARSRGMNVFMKEEEEQEYDIMQQVLDFVEEHNEDAPKQKRGKILKKDYGCLYKMMLELHLSLLRHPDAASFSTPAILPCKKWHLTSGSYARIDTQILYYMLNGAEAAAVDNVVHARKKQKLPMTGLRILMQRKTESRQYLPS